MKFLKILKLCISTFVIICYSSPILSSTISKAKDWLGWQEELGDTTSLADISETMLLAARTRLRRRLAPSTVNALFAVLKTYLNWAYEEGHIPERPHRRIRKLNEPRDPTAIRCWTMDQVRLALECARAIDEQVRERVVKKGEKRSFATAELLVAAGCFLGLRLEGLIMLRWQDLDLQAKNPRTGQPAPVCHVVPHDGWQPKTGSARTVPIYSSLLAILLAHQRPEGYVLVSEKAVSKRGGTKRVYRYDPTALWRRINKLIVERGGVRIPLGAMRHAFASNLLVAGESDVKVARWLGHANTEMVHRHYGHLMSYDDGINRMSFE